ncbi:AraC family transcriptional regulator [Pectobacterium brasiliense]|uniref:AraC family transcriptional regulator n=1 Tax=Pectobacterium brasiliense TaxID=180957 RepID=A0AAW9GZH9_9GAMM|nr:AraC family transcriptional regulator [Pectobacterium brasiliense]MDY4376824.1 AraC family transcriptional regulator [Pectobacterium brasiliense]
MPEKYPSKLSDVAVFENLRTLLAENIARHTVGNRDIQSAITGLTLFRRETPMPPTLCLVETSIVLAVQGEKQMLVAEKSYPYNAERFLITSLDIPANSQVLKASQDKPCLGFAFRLDLRIMAELIAQEGLSQSDSCLDGDTSGIGLGTMTSELLEPFKRMIDLLDEPQSIPVLAPLIEREIHYRLIQSEQGARLRNIASVGSQGHRIARAISWLKTHYSQVLRIEELAAYVQMSPSSLYQHFRQLTALSPLQYQKLLRLNEARRLMFSEGMNAASAGFQVGYESPSQFSREYTNLFGAPPRRDIEALRRKFFGQSGEM